MHTVGTSASARAIPHADVYVTRIKHRRGGTHKGPTHTEGAHTEDARHQRERPTQRQGARPAQETGSDPHKDKGRDPHRRHTDTVDTFLKVPCAPNTSKQLFVIKLYERLWCCGS